ncbi:3-hydroxybenzoate 6-monooxygenase [Halomonas heilongjiangensis]|uniref:Salicylate hydroxylase n=1 Tax=Halomonas heilongjiangensis TaxID=1387883 RepID=A0A2N7TGZ5_9GAMM|nr:3-hydroxybenzoate 6-monooxygenase [Halomonas heilongjiangensis]PMR67461.1 salicylate hydroxylase [Halomonas heilongjiangensis]PXX87095.1 salicylate hydroxylase [Halomonas heilongjiangensis]
MNNDTIIIAGGGIGGLAAALGLARQGIPSLVLEQAPELGEIGAGIQIGPNAFHAFDYLGVGDEARAKAVYIDNLLLMDAMEDRRIAAIPLDEAFRARFNNPYAVVHRADLHKVLLDACEANVLVELRTDSRVVDYTQDATSATVILADGERVTGKCLIGAEGLKSPIRQKVIGDGEPRVSGHTTYRSVIPTAQMPEELRWNAATLWAGPKCHIVHYPLKGGEVYNLVVTYHNDAPEPVAGKPVTREEVYRGFAHIAERPRQIIEHGQDWKMWVLCDRDPNDHWIDGRVVLLGDAAHPMLQYMAQGACMAMEDAVCLSYHLGHKADLADAFLAYRDDRFARTARVQTYSRLMGEYIYHPDGGKAAMRNATLRAMSPEDFYDRIEWLYGGSGLSNVTQ